MPDFPLLEQLLEWSAQSLHAAIRAGTPWLERWGMWAVGVGLFAETLFFTGAVAPGFGILIAAGFLVAAGVLDPWTTLVVAVLGAVAGDQASYWVGRFFGGRALGRRAARLADTRSTLESEGSAVLLWYHYSPPLRVVVPATAGIMRFSAGRFAVWDTVGVTIWIVIVGAVGFSARSVTAGGTPLVLHVAAVLTTAGGLWYAVRLRRRVLDTRAQRAPRLVDSDAPTGGGPGE